MLTGKGGIRIGRATDLQLHHWRLGRVPKDWIPTMRTHRKEENQPSNWRFTVEQIGRELRKLYPPAETPAALRALFTEERRQREATHRNHQKADESDDRNSK
jgi:hypothetical protein